MLPIAAAADLDFPPRSVTLWVDGCGGFRLLTGSRWSVGGALGDEMSDIAVQTNWPRCAGWIHRDRGEYLWHEAGKDPLWMRQTSVVPVSGGVKLRLERPSPLSQSATLRLESKHRFAKQVDAIVLVHDTVIIGPGNDCHVRCRGLTQRSVLVDKAGNWRIKLGKSPAQQLQLGQRFQADEMSLMLAEE